MASETCKCGCGEEISAANKNGYKWGHKQRALPGTATTALATTEDMVIDLPEAPQLIAMEMTEQQIDRIYALLPVTEKALGVLTALEADRS